MFRKINCFQDIKAPIFLSFFAYSFHIDKISFRKIEGKVKYIHAHNMAGSIAKTAITSNRAFSFLIRLSWWCYFNSSHNTITSIKQFKLPGSNPHGFSYLLEGIHCVTVINISQKQGYCREAFDQTVEENST